MMAAWSLLSCVSKIMSWLVMKWTIISYVNGKSISGKVIIANAFSLYKFSLLYLHIPHSLILNDNKKKRVKILFQDSVEDILIAEATYIT